MILYYVLHSGAATIRASGAITLASALFVRTKVRSSLGSSREQGKSDRTLLPDILLTTVPFLHKTKI